MSIYKGTQLISGVATPIEPTRNIGQIIPSLLPLTDAGLHLLDGTVISGNGIYKAFVDYISKLDLTASYFTTEADWQASVSQYGVCGKFVYDASANTVRLPKVTGFVEGTIDPNALGDLVEAGLPAHTHTRGTMNITGTFTNNGHGDGAATTGAFTGGQDSNKKSNDGSATDGGVFGFDASRSWTGSTSNPNYTDNIKTTNTVQPQTIKGYYYIVVATSVKTDIEVDIDNVVTDLNSKVDISNMVEVPTIIETYVNGTSWYRVWSDGWCEQGGIAQATENTKNYQVALLKEYKDRYYNIACGQCFYGDYPGSSATTSYDALNQYANTINNKTTTSFRFQFLTGNADGRYTSWITKGYIS